MRSIAHFGARSIGFSRQLVEGVNRLVQVGAYIASKKLKSYPQSPPAVFVANPGKLAASAANASKRRQFSAN